MAACSNGAVRLLANSIRKLTHPGCLCEFAEAVTQLEQLCNSGWLVWWEHVCHLLFCSTHATCVCACSSWAGVLRRDDSRVIPLPSVLSRLIAVTEITWKCTSSWRAKLLVTLKESLTARVLSGSEKNCHQQWKLKGTQQRPRVPACHFSAQYQSDTQRLESSY